MDKQDDTLTIEMTETVPAGQTITAHLADQTTSFYYQ